MKPVLVLLLALGATKGQPGSAKFNCLQPGQCQGSQTGGSPDNTLGACLELCYNSPDCSWWSYDPIDSYCQLLSSCDSVDDVLCPECLYGEKGCYEQEVQDVDVLLVTSGYNTDDDLDGTVDVVPLDSPYMTCPDLPDFTHPLTNGKGFSHQNRPVVCPLLLNENCYKLSNDMSTWEQFVELSFYKSYAAGAFIGEDYMILGGLESANTTERFSAGNEAFFAGPVIPYLVWAQCAATFNEETVVMTGGYSRVNSNQFIIGNAAALSVIEESWAGLPDITMPRCYHACGIATSADGSSSAIIAGGYNDTNALSSTEILHLDSSAAGWQAGVDVPGGGITGSCSVPYKNSFLMVGGYMPEGQETTAAIWQYDPDNSTMPWVLRPEQLPVGRRSGPVAILFKALDLGCTLEA